MEDLMGNGGRMIERFREGRFVAKNEIVAYEYARLIKEVKKVYAGAERVSFVLALVACLKKPQFSFEEFMDKLKYKSTMLVDCTTTTSYLSLIEEIYNYKRKEKVNLRF